MNGKPHIRKYGDVYWCQHYDEGKAIATGMASSPLDAWRLWCCAKKDAKDNPFPTLVDKLNKELVNNHGWIVLNQTVPKLLF